MSDQIHATAQAMIENAQRNVERVRHIVCPKCGAIMRLHVPAELSFQLADGPSMRARGHNTVRNDKSLTDWEIKCKCGHVDSDRPDWLNEEIQIEVHNAIYQFSR